MRPYQIRGRWYRPEHQPHYDVEGIASWYGDAFHGRPTATGERFDMTLLTAAHTTLPLPSLVEVTNLENGRTIIVRVNDRGPFVDDRLIDLSRAAADALDMRRAGLARVRVRYLGPAPRGGGGGEVRTAGPLAEPVATEPPGLWYVQAGSFADMENARRLARSLPQDERPHVRRAEGLGLHRVLLGPWRDRAEAERARSLLAGQGLLDALVIQE